MGYYLGGFDSETYTSEFGHGAPTPNPGLIVYNMTANTWANVSSTGYPAGRISFLGGMQHVPLFGDEGLLLIFGGDQSGPTQWGQNATNLQAFSSVNIYDPSTDNWYVQQTTGDIPPAAEMFCEVGIQSDQSTFEI